MGWMNLFNFLTVYLAEIVLKDFDLLSALTSVASIGLSFLETDLFLPGKLTFILSTLLVESGLTYALSVVYSINKSKFGIQIFFWFDFLLSANFYDFG